jgi:hypothetical protein
MVHVEFWRPSCVSVATHSDRPISLPGRQQPQIAGREPQVVYRSAYLLAEVAHDDDPGRSEIDQQAPDERRLVVGRGERRDSENV